MIETISFKVAPIVKVTVPVDPSVSVYSVSDNKRPFWNTKHCPSR